MRWSRAAAPAYGDARGRRATLVYTFANEGCYNDPYCYCIAYACRYAAGNPNGDAFPKVRCYALFTHPEAPADDHDNEHADAPADDHDNEHADAPAEANAGSHAHTHTDLASDDL